MVAELVGVRAERHAAAQEPALPVCGAHGLERELEHVGDLGVGELPREARLDQADEGIHGVVRHERPRRRQCADDLDRLGRQPDLLVGLAQRGRGQVGVLGVAPPTRERDLAGVALEVVAALGEDGVELTVLVEVERGEDGGLGAAVDVDGQRGVRREQGAAQLLREFRPGPQASSTRSSNRTSPSSVRWTGHLAAITCRRSTWSSERWAGIRMTSVKFVAHPRSAGV